jgi:hypothetical protein
MEVAVNQLSRTTAARAALASKLGDMSSLEKGKERTQKAIEWIYRWGWASPTTLEILAGTQRSGLSQRLIKNQLLISTKTLSRRTEKFLPGTFLTLTPTGRHLAEVKRESQMPYECRPERINQNHLLHDEMAQRATAERLAAGTIKDYLTEKEMQGRSMNCVKHPDVAWIFPDGLRVSVEIELSPKWERDLDTFVHSTLISLSKKDGPARFDRMVLVTDSPAICKRYQAAFLPGATYSLWKKNDKGRWVAVHQAQVPSWSNERIMWKLI